MKPEGAGTHLIPAAVLHNHLILTAVQLTNSTVSHTSEAALHEARENRNVGLKVSVIPFEGPS